LKKWFFSFNSGSSGSSHLTVYHIAQVLLIYNYLMVEVYPKFGSIQSEGGSLSS